MNIKDVNVFLSDHICISVILMKLKLDICDNPYNPHNHSNKKYHHK